jgi:hypothetical protein
MDKLGGFETVAAFSAGIISLPVFAEQVLGESQGQRQMPTSRRSEEEQGMRKTFAMQHLQ